ncbi:tyrosine-type recombinase/integrase [Citrobacter koseri]|uniref:tyrosine-type recombinase/integrase n=1 Tax=Citrobacter koseri TaxID=545 RepID=UPI002B36B4F2|nr:tyrosine-type recombinase/integrase [Citrobacter koseri]MEB2704031.1 tyrosine-type recombinase/integrase [Citrobacter koseri]MEB2709588.1 tyrosine-type recombinase/integrase [Citrobacter koseri]
MKTTGIFTLKDLPAVFKASKRDTVFYRLSTPEIRIKDLECGCPEYLLSTELITLLHYLPNLYQQMFIYTLWNTGADVNEVRQLTRNSFFLKQPYPYVQFPDSSTNLNAKNAHSYTGTKFPFHGRLIPLLNKHYVTQLKQLFFSQKLLCPSADNNLIWNIDNNTAAKWLNNALHLAHKDGVQFPVNINLDIIKHSYAAYLLTQGVPPVILQKIITT